MGFWFTIVHRSNQFLIKPDYWSRAELDVTFDLSLAEYIKLCTKYKEDHPPPSDNLTSRNILGHRSNSVQSLKPEDSLINSYQPVPSCLYHIPVKYPSEKYNHLNLLSSTIVESNCNINIMSWCVYGFSTGHIFQYKESSSCLFVVIFGANVNPLGRSMLINFRTKNMSLMVCLH